MARIRTIKPEFWSDGTLMECSLNARLLFIGTWNFADDNGNLDRSAKQIKARIFPGDSIDCEPLIQELIAHGRLIEYSVNGKNYLHIHKFNEHQVINRPGKPHCPLYEPSLNTPGMIRDGSGLKGREGKGEERKGKETATAPDATRPSPKQNGHRIEFDTLQGAFKGISEDDELRWQEAYPAVPIPPAIAQAAAWLKANPANRKSNNERFLVNWFKREQDKAARVRQ